MESAQRSPRSTGSGQALWQALNLAWELGYTIAIPLVIFALLGRWADGAFHTKPWLFLAGILLAISASSILLVRKFSRLIREMNLVRTPDKISSQDIQISASKEHRSNGVNLPKQ